MCVPMIPRTSGKIATGSTTQHFLPAGIAAYLLARCPASPARLAGPNRSRSLG
jgi:hypothetical protein